MRFSKAINKYLHNHPTVIVGDIKLSKAYLYMSHYEIEVRAIRNRKVVDLRLLDLKQDRLCVLTLTGTPTAVLNRAVGFIRLHDKNR